MRPSTRENASSRQPGFSPSLKSTETISALNFSLVNQMVSSPPHSSCSPPLSPRLLPPGSPRHEGTQQAQLDRFESKLPDMVAAMVWSLFRSLDEINVKRESTTNECPTDAEGRGDYDNVTLLSGLSLNRQRISSIKGVRCTSLDSCWDSSTFNRPHSGQEHSLLIHDVEELGMLDEDGDEFYLHEPPDIEEETLPDEHLSPSEKLKRREEQITTGDRDSNLDKRIVREAEGKTKRDKQQSGWKLEGDSIRRKQKSNEISDNINERSDSYIDGKGIQVIKSPVLSKQNSKERISLRSKSPPLAVDSPNQDDYKDKDRDKTRESDKTSGRTATSPSGSKRSAEASQLMDSKLDVTNRLAQNACARLRLPNPLGPHHSANLVNMFKHKGMISLETEKRRVKNELRIFDCEFEKKFGYPPTKEDKEPMRNLYVYYRQVKITVAKAENGNSDLRTDNLGSGKISPTGRSSSNKRIGTSEVDRARQESGKRESTARDKNGIRENKPRTPSGNRSGLSEAAQDLIVSRENINRRIENANKANIRALGEAKQTDEKRHHRSSAYVMKRTISDNASDTSRGTIGTTLPQELPLSELEHRLQSLIKQKNGMSKKLQEYQDEFLKQKGRPIRFHRDIMPVDKEYRQYKRLRGAVDVLRSTINTRNAVAQILTSSESCDNDKILEGPSVDGTGWV